MTRSGRASTVVYDQPPWSATEDGPSSRSSGSRPSSSCTSRRAPCSGDSPACSAPPGVPQVPPWCDQSARCCSSSSGPSAPARCTSSTAATTRPQCRWPPAQVTQPSVEENTLLSEPCPGSRRRRDRLDVVRVAVFTGSQSGPPSHRSAVAEFAAGVASAGVGIVYGGGRAGLMGVVADAALAAGGHVIGVIPQHLVDDELAHPGLPQLEVVGSMHERKARMAELADAFVALPGAAGTQIGRAHV